MGKAGLLDGEGRLSEMVEVESGRVTAFLQEYLLPLRKVKTSFAACRREKRAMHLINCACRIAALVALASLPLRAQQASGTVTVTGQVSTVATISAGPAARVVKGEARVAPEAGGAQGLVISLSGPRGGATQVEIPVQLRSNADFAFIVLTMGWLLTSQQSREFLAQQRAAYWWLLIAIVVTGILHVGVCNSHYRRLQKKFNLLIREFSDSDSPYTEKEYYVSYKITPLMVWTNLLLSLFLFAALFMIVFSL
jgi:hypothetical protein